MAVPKDYTSCSRHFTHCHCTISICFNPTYLRFLPRWHHSLGRLSHILGMDCSPLHQIQHPSLYLLHCFVLARAHTTPSSPGPFLPSVPPQATPGSMNACCSPFQTPSILLVIALLFPRTSTPRSELYEGITRNDGLGIPRAHTQCKRPPV